MEYIYTQLRGPNCNVYKKYEYNAKEWHFSQNKLNDVKICNLFDFMKEPCISNDI